MIKHKRLTYQLHHLHYSESDGDEYAFHLGSGISINMVTKKPLFDITIHSSKIRVMTDLGATVNILNKTDYLGLKNQPELLSSTSKIFLYMSTKPLDLCGKFQSEINYEHHVSRETFLCCIWQ